MDDNLYYKQPTYTNTCSDADDSSSFPSFPWFPGNIRRRKSRLGTHRNQVRILQDVTSNDGDHSSSNKENIFDRLSSDTSPCDAAQVDVLTDKLKPVKSPVFDAELKTSPFSFRVGKYGDPSSVLSIPEVFDDRISPVISPFEESKNKMPPFPSHRNEDVIDGILKEINSSDDAETPCFSLSPGCNKTRISELKLDGPSVFQRTSSRPVITNEFQIAETRLNRSFSGELPNDLSSVGGDFGSGLENSTKPSNNSLSAPVISNASLDHENFAELPDRLSHVAAIEDVNSDPTNLIDRSNNTFSRDAKYFIDLNNENFNQIPNDLSLKKAVKNVDLSHKELSPTKLKNESPSVSSGADIPPTVKKTPIHHLTNGKVDSPVIFDSILEQNRPPLNNKGAIPPSEAVLIDPPGPSKPAVHFAEIPVVREFVAPRNSPKIPPVINVKGKSYKVLNILGTGGSSVVYQVSHPETNELLAVKKVDLPEEDDDITEGYLNEVQMLESLQNCDVIIKIFDHQLAYKNGKKTLYVVMEKGDTDLSSLIRSVNESKKLSIPMIIYYWTEMLAAVNEVHRRGIIHSDLKPANFVLVRGRLKLIDFGIASSIQGDMTSVYKDTFCGTLNYMSPEATNYVRFPSGSTGFKITFKTDVWSLGCILYNLVYGYLPFYHIKRRIEKMQAIISPDVNVDFPEKKDVPPILISLLKSCLDKNYKRRPTVQELLDRTMRIFQCSSVD